ncbi:MAG: helix-turn-helix transcriptional regulator [Ktedonobacteraceae bacterium]
MKLGNVHKPNATLRQERRLRGWSQSEMARRLNDVVYKDLEDESEDDAGKGGVTTDMVSKWEIGVYVPSLFYQKRLCQLFQRTAAELGLMDDILESVHQMDTHQTQEQQPNSLVSLTESVDKRSISSLIMVHQYQYNIYDKPLQEIDFNQTEPGTLKHFAEITETCRHLSEGNELKTAEHVLWAYLPRVETIAKLSFEQQREAASITSQGYLLAASLAGHRNDLQARHHHSEQALLYGKLATDRNLQIAAMRQLSITFDYLERPDTVLQIYQQTLPYLNEVSPLLQACIYAGVSGAYAQLKQQQEALRFMGLAYEHLPEHPEYEPSFLGTICRYSTLVFFEGLNYLELGQPHEAEKVFAKIDGLQPKIQLPERVRIELLNYQIETFITLEYMEQACIYLEQAVSASYSLGSKKRLQESLSLFQQMQKIWPYEQLVKQLKSLFIR